MEGRMDRLEGRNVVLEALSRGRRPVRVIWLDEGARVDGKLDRILALAAKQGVRIQRVNRREIDRRARGDVHNGILADAEPLARCTVDEVVRGAFFRDEVPFLALADEVQYEHNLGAILRSGLGAGLHGLIVPTRRGAGLSPVVARVAMGAAEEIPVIREGLFSALKKIKRLGVRIVGADMGGKPPWDVDLTGPIALVLGGESKGLSPTLRSRCDAIVGVPLQGGLESLNVSVTAGILFFERVRQLSRV
jgi:23S rRNA (guanosine2251-2'-O)-methyltransferase